MLEKLRFHPAWPASIIVLFCLLMQFYQKPWQYKPIIEWDIHNYYSYLPNTFITGDYHQRTWNADSNRMEIVTYSLDAPEKMTAGLSVLYAPAFLAVHYLAPLLGYKADGYSLPYRIGLVFALYPWLWLGLFYLYKVLFLVFKKEWLAFWIPLLLFFNSNLYHYSVYENAMSHAFTFSLMSIFMYNVLQWWRTALWGYTIMAGLLAGLVVWIRPINLILLLFALFAYHFLKMEVNWKKKWLQITEHALVLAFVAFLVLLPQLLYWKHISGQWVYYSYGEEGFFWSDPKIFSGLFSFRKGLFVYSPTLLLLFPGFLALWSRFRWGTTLLFALISLFVYVTFSWWCWWYGGGFGARTLIDAYPLLALPMGAALYMIARLNMWIKPVAIASLILLAGLSVFQTHQYKNGLIHHDGNTWKSYKYAFLKKKHPPGWWDFLYEPDYDKAVKGIGR